jgi:hypothetical protein
VVIDEEHFTQIVVLVCVGIDEHVMTGQVIKMIICGEVNPVIIQLENDLVILDGMFLLHLNGTDCLRHGVNIDDEMIIYVRYLNEVIRLGQLLQLVHQMLL